MSAGTGGYRRIPGKGRHTGQSPLVALGIVAELHGTPPGTIEPDGEAVVIEPQRFRCRMAETTDQEQANKHAYSVGLHGNSRGVSTLQRMAFLSDRSISYLAPGLQCGGGHTTASVPRS